MLVDAQLNEVSHLHADSLPPMIWHSGIIGEFTDGIGAVLGHTVMGVRKLEKMAIFSAPVLMVSEGKMLPLSLLMRMSSCKGRYKCPGLEYC